MAYDEGQAQRLREMLSEQHGITERKMFGGLAFMSHGHMFIGLQSGTLMARVGPLEYARVLGQAHVRPMDFTGKPMKGYVFVDALGLESDATLESWVQLCLTFVSGLPPKPAK